MIFIWIIKIKKKTQYNKFSFFFVSLIYQYYKKMIQFKDFKLKTEIISTSLKKNKISLLIHKTPTQIL